MNPIIKTFALVVVWVLLGLLSMFFFPNSGGDSIILYIIIITLDGAPIVSVVLYAILLFRNKQWFSEHKIGAVLFSLLLLVWLIYMMPDIWGLLSAI